MHYISSGILLLSFFCLSASGHVSQMEKDFQLCKKSKHFMQLNNDSTQTLGWIFNKEPKIKCLSLQNIRIENILNNAFLPSLNLLHLLVVNDEIISPDLEFASKIPNLETLVLERAYNITNPTLKLFHLDNLPPKLKLLSLANNGIEKLTIRNKTNIEHLTYLILRDNKIREINTDDKNNFAWLAQTLEYLDVSGNELEKLIITNKNGLKYLLAEENPLKKLRLENLENLENIDIFSSLNCQLDEFIVKNLSNLKSLSLSHYEIHKISSNDIRDLPQLKTLYLSSCRMKHFDGKIVDSAPLLTTLYLDSNQLTAVPNISKAQNLNEFVLRNNKIDNLAKEDFQGMPNLKQLDLSYNMIKDLKPSTFTHIRKLEILNIQGNQLKTVRWAADFSLKNLKKLLLSDNKITHFDGNIINCNQHLEEVDLSNNLLKNVPLINKAPSLMVLSLGENEIQTLKSSDFNAALKNLEKLHLLFNNITEIEPNTFNELRNLEMLTLRSNKLSKLPDGWMRSLKNLRILTLQENNFENYEALALHDSEISKDTTVVYSLKNTDDIYCSYKHNLDTFCIMLADSKSKTVRFIKRNK